jgi:hypothetical protein
MASMAAGDVDDDPHAALYEMGVDDSENEADERARELTVAKIPALVREGGPRDAVS